MVLLFVAGLQSAAVRDALGGWGGSGGGEAMVASVPVACTSRFFSLPDGRYPAPAASCAFSPYDSYGTLLRGISTVPLGGRFDDV